MPLETATFINQLDAANPLGSDPIAAGDDHIRLIKSAVKATFPNITGAVSVSHTDLNTKVPNALQTTGGTMTGALVLSGAPTVDLNPATKKYVDDLGATKADKTVTMTAGTGLTGGGDLSANRTLAIANTGVTAGSYGSATQVPVLTVNAQGQVTAASTATIVPFAWNVVYVNTSVGEGSSYSIPANCIQVNGYVTTTFGGNTGGLARLTIRDGSSNTLGSTLAGLTSGNDGGGGAGFFMPISIPVSSSASSIAVSREAGGNGVSFVVTSYVTRA